jgi:hypothetical protein
MLAASSNIADDFVSAVWAGYEREEQGRGGSGRGEFGGCHGRGEEWCLRWVVPVICEFVLGLLYERRNGDSDPASDEKEEGPGTF